MNREEMIDALKRDVCRVTFKKVNGDTRLMYCTLNHAFLPENDRMVNEAGFEPTKQLVQEFKPCAFDQTRLLRLELGNYLISHDNGLLVNWRFNSFNLQT